MIPRWIRCQCAILGIITYFPLPRVLCKAGVPATLFYTKPSVSVKHVVGSVDLLFSVKAPACTSIDSSYSCFVSKVDETVQYELDPVHIFTDNLSRCNSSAECSSFSSCVVPRRDQQLVRISILRSHGDTSVEDMVVWKGPKDEIWEQGT